MNKEVILRLIPPPLLWLFSIVVILSDPFLVLYWFQD